MVHEILLQVARGLHPVDVDFVQPAAQPLHRLRVGDPLQIEHIHLRPGPAAHDVLPDLQLRGLQMPADHGRVGADRLHEGLPYPLQGGFVLRLPHRALLLGGHRQGECIGPPGEKQGAAAQDQVVDHVLQGGPPVGRQVVQRPVLEQGKQFLLRSPAEGGVLGQGPEDIVAQPLVPGHTQQIAHCHRALPVPMEVYLPLHIVHTALKHPPQ